jgi:hypothetical protein
MKTLCVPVTSTFSRTSHWSPRQSCSRRVAGEDRIDVSRSFHTAFFFAITCSLCFDEADSAVTANPSEVRATGLSLDSGRDWAALYRQGSDNLHLRGAMSSVFCDG